MKNTSKLVLTLFLLSISSLNEVNATAEIEMELEGNPRCASCFSFVKGLFKKKNNKLIRSSVKMINNDNKNVTSGQSSILLRDDSMFDGMIAPNPTVAADRGASDKK